MEFLQQWHIKKADNLTKNVKDKLKRAELTCSLAEGYFELIQVSSI